MEKESTHGVFYIQRYVAKTLFLPLVHIMLRIVQPNAHLQSVSLSTPLENIFHVLTPIYTWNYTFGSTTYQAIFIWTNYVNKKTKL